MVKDHSFPFLSRTQGLSHSLKPAWQHPCQCSRRRCVLSSFQNLFFWTGSLKIFELPLLLGSCLQIGIINAEAWCRHQYRRWCCAAVREGGRDVCSHCWRERREITAAQGNNMEGEPQIRLAPAPPRLKREVASVPPPRTRAGGGRPEMVCAWGRAMRPCPCWGWSSPPRNAMARRPDTQRAQRQWHMPKARGIHTAALGQPWL